MILKGMELKGIRQKRHKVNKLGYFIIKYYFLYRIHLVNMCMMCINDFYLGPCGKKLKENFYKPHSGIVF